ncbi:MAG: hypothetical protein COX51_08165 [Syntrophobacteraceae bacterium CG23_combo_of_CG06-09_8_20_14_all_50_8]|nr:MAG: hypothetical protein COX51_08165 [Syntrophobacteraceae bacterium CG23_combo_of_CG06-09_8_20_14_all_50_8]
MTGRGWNFLFSNGCRHGIQPFGRNHTSHNIGLFAKYGGMLERPCWIKHMDNGCVEIIVYITIQICIIA